MRQGWASVFASTFVETYEAKCVDHDQTKQRWLGSPAEWTNLMLDRDHGVLTETATRWAKEVLHGESFRIFHERRKIDLMVAKGDSEDLFATTPLAAVEHENNHDLEVEAWNLASWRVPLRVLVYYSDASDAADKLFRISEVVRRIERQNTPCGEFLLVTAPWKFGDRLTWRASTWLDGAFEEFATVA